MGGPKNVPFFNSLAKNVQYDMFPLLSCCPSFLIQPNVAHMQAVAALRVGLFALLSYITCPKPLLTVPTSVGRKSGMLLCFLSLVVIGATGRMVYPSD